MQIELTATDLSELRNSPLNWGDNILYTMCEKNSGHGDLDVVIGKVWLIGRAYSATIERKAGNAMQPGKNFYIATVGPKILASEIDDWIQPLSNYSRIDNTNIEKILEVHNKLTQLFRNITSSDKSDDGVSKRSLASKYLHFHLPSLFFIYDSIAKNEINECMKTLNKKKKRQTNLYKYDKEYEIFVMNCLELRENFEEKLEERLSTRDLDRWLFSRHDKRITIGSGN